MTASANRQTAIPSDPPPGWECEVPKYRVTIKGGVYPSPKRSLFAWNRRSLPPQIRTFGNMRCGHTRKVRSSKLAIGRTRRFFS
jgi:hypothetical protein